MLGQVSKCRRSSGNYIFKNAERLASTVKDLTMSQRVLRYRKIFVCNGFSEDSFILESQWHWPDTGQGFQRYWLVRGTFCMWWSIEDTKEFSVMPSYVGNVSSLIHDLNHIDCEGEAMTVFTFLISYDRINWLLFC